jgi:hypothetical protein
MEAHSVKAIAAAPRANGEGGNSEAPMRCTLPGRAIASSTARNVDCADSTGSAKPAVSIVIPRRAPG